MQPSSSFSSSRPVAVVTGALSGIGYNLAKCCAENGFDAMMDGEADVVAGLKNKLQVAMSKVLPSQAVAEQHRKMAKPGTAQNA